MKLRTNNKWKKFYEISYREEVSHVINDEETVISISPLEGNITISLNTNFSAFGDELKIHLVSSNPEEDRKVSFGSGIKCEDISIKESVFIKFENDGKEFIPVSGSSSDLKIGAIVNNSEIGCPVYTDRNNLLKQDAEYFYYNDKKKFLSIGHNDPRANLDIVGLKRQIKISTNAPKDEECSIEFSSYGQEPEWVLGAFGKNLEDFCLKNLKTGRVWKLNPEENKENNETTNKPNTKNKGKK